MSKVISDSELNHLRRLLGYIRCDIDQPPEEIVQMVRGLLPHMEPLCEEGKARLVEAYQRSASVPKYVRAAVKALEKVVRESPDSETKTYVPALVIGGWKAIEGERID